MEVIKEIFKQSKRHDPVLVAEPNLTSCSMSVLYCINTLQTRSFGENNNKETTTRDTRRQRKTNKAFELFYIRWKEEEEEQ